LSYTSTDTGLLTGGWLAESVRVTLFSDEIEPASLLLQLVGIPPELVNERPAQNFRQESTPYKAGQLVINHQPGRLDLFYAPRTPTNMFEASNSGPLVYVSELDAALNEIHHLGAKLCGFFPSVVKIALCPIAIKQTATSSDAAILIKNSFPGLPILDERDSAVTWQVSRKSPARSFKGNLYSIYKLQSISTQMMPPYVQSRQPAFSQPMITVNFARFELEVNTDVPPNIDILPGKIFEELSLAVKQFLTRPGQ